MKVSIDTLKSYAPTTDIAVAEAQFENLLDSFRHKDDGIAIEEVNDLAEAIADPVKFLQFLEGLIAEEAVGVVLTATEEGISFAPLNIPAAAVAAGAGMTRTGEGVIGSEYYLHSTTIIKKLSIAPPAAVAVVIPHLLERITTDSAVAIMANCAAAKGFDWVEIDEENVTIHYTAPPAGEQGLLKYTLITNQIYE